MLGVGAIGADNLEIVHANRGAKPTVCGRCYGRQTIEAHRWVRRFRGQ
jgi:hypothetical protein